METEVASRRNRTLVPTGSRGRKKAPAVTVGFRLDPYYHTLLEKGAAAYGISKHEYARQRLTELLDRQEEGRLLEEAELTRREVADLREDLARALEVLLVNLTPADGHAVRSWISQNLRRG